MSINSKFAVKVDQLKAEHEVLDDSSIQGFNQTLNLLFPAGTWKDYRVTQLILKEKKYLIQKYIHKWSPILNKVEIDH